MKRVDCVQWWSQQIGGSCAKKHRTNFCVSFNDVTMFTQPWYDLFTNLAYNFITYFGGHGPNAPYLMH